MSAPSEDKGTSGSLRADEALARGRSRLGAAGIDSGGRDAELLLRAVTGWERAYVLTHPEALLSAEAAEQYDASLKRRAAGEPVQYITGVQEFWGLALKVTPAVLIPRPETEHLVEAVMARVSREDALRIADVGTGSGAIAIALARELPNATVVATDISGAALEVARENAARHDDQAGKSVAERIQYEACDLLPAEIGESWMWWRRIRHISARASGSCWRARCGSLSRGARCLRERRGMRFTRG